MRLFSKEAWSYAVLLIILFAIAAIAVWETLQYLAEHIDGKDYAVAAILICAITFGFMLIAGAFGLWAVQFAAAAEGRRRVGRFVDAMDYLHDGLLTLDPKGRITGSNPAARSMTPVSLDRPVPLQDAFGCLGESDTMTLIRAAEPFEIERQHLQDEGPRTYRFRSQPSEGLTLVLVSDVSSMQARRMHNRQVARLQLIGEIARGVAYDFNNILCAVSGHASLVARLPPGSADMQRSLQAIAAGAERGTALAAHLLDLAVPGAMSPATTMSVEYIEAAVETLRGSLSPEWRIESNLQALEPVALTGLKIEQIVLNLGLQAADSAPAPAVLHVVARPPSTDRPIFNVERNYSGVLVVAATDMDDVTMASRPGDRSVQSGVIVSVIRGMIEEANGTLDCFTSTDGAPVYRVALPRGRLHEDGKDENPMAAELGPYIAHWTVVVGAQRHHLTRLEERLTGFGVTVERGDDIASLLACLEAQSRLDAVLIDTRIVVKETAGFIRAIVKLCPRAAVVLLVQDDTETYAALAGDVITVNQRENPERIILAMIEAKSLAIRRTAG